MERVSNSAVPVSSVPRSADRAASDASSAGLRADMSSSAGSTPISRKTAFAIPLSSRISGPANVVKPRWNPTTARPTRIGSAIAQFFGTSSPNTIWAPVASTKATVNAVAVTAASGRPESPIGPRSSAPSEGSAMNPTTSEVMVIPS